MSPFLHPEHYPVLRELPGGYWRVEAPSGHYEASSRDVALGMHLAHGNDIDADCPCAGEGFYFVGALIRRVGPSTHAGTRPLRVPCESCEAYQEVMSWHPDERPDFVIGVAA